MSTLLGAATVTVPLGLDIAAVAVGAVFGALVAVRRDMDLTGTIGLAVMGGLGGGVVRDMLLNQVPVALTSDVYLPVALGVGVLMLVLHPAAGRLDDVLDLFDAFALGLFAIVGASRALDAGLGPVAAAAVGVVAATAGGVFCDLLSGQRPYIFGPGPIYGLAAAAGSATYVAVDRLADSVAAGIVVSMVVTVGLRLLAVHRGLATRTAAEARLGRGRRVSPPGSGASRKAPVVVLVDDAAPGEPPAGSRGETGGPVDHGDADGSVASVPADQGGGDRPVAPAPADQGGGGGPVAPAPADRGDAVGTARRRPDAR